MDSKQDIQPLRTIDEINDMKNSLLRHFSYRDYMLFSMGINVGLRVSDLVRFKVKDVRGKERYRIKEKKTNKTNSLKFPEPLRKLIDEYTKDMDNEDFLFQSRNGRNKPLTTNQVYRILVKAGELCDLKNIGTHTMRKTFGYHYYQRTKDIGTLMVIFNHSSQKVTKLYIGISQDEIDESLEGYML
ncbi:hypothetical protein BTS2_3336 [Bacillus sp. TS-2]|nr:hypothetical protein BTS2_3336 [Bacillus sp. TS-2]